MSQESELALYAHKKASIMGLKKPLYIKVDPQLGFNCYMRRARSHRIQLVSPNKSCLRHELGHAYISEKFSRLFNFFDKFAKPLNFLAEKFGEFGELASNMIYGLALGTTLLFGILFAYKDGLSEISLLLILVGIGLIVPMIEEFLAFYFGKKYEPRN